MQTAEELKSLNRTIIEDVEPGLAPMLNAHFEKVVMPKFEAIFKGMGIPEEMREEVWEDFLAGRAEVTESEDLETLYAEMVTFEDDAYPVALRAHGLTDLADLYRKDREAFGRLLDQGQYLEQAEKAPD